MSSGQTLAYQPKNILVIAMRYLGDVLLTTPLLHSLRQAYPNAQIDVLVFRNTAAMLEGNPDIDDIIVTPNRPKFSDYRQLFGRIFRRYGLAVVTQPGDRPFLYGLLAAPVRIAAVPPKNATGWWKRYLVRHWVEFDDENTHTVLQHLKLLDLINIPKHFSLVPPRIGDARQLAEQHPLLSGDMPYAVLHPHPQWTYKQWTVDGWLAVGRYLHDRGIKLVLSGGPGQEEAAYAADIQRQLPEDTINLAGKVSLAQLASIIAGAKLFIGPDTGITHLAAATGIPVIALYGPTNPIKWAPWPVGFNQDSNPFRKKGSQRINNITLLQGEGDCVPCHLEGCDRHRQSRSRCLDDISPERVEQAIQVVLDYLGIRVGN